MGSSQLSGAAKLGALITMAMVRPEMTAVAGRVTGNSLAFVSIDGEVRGAE